MKAVAAIAAVVVLAIIGVGLAMYLRFIPIPGPILALLVGTRPPEHSARFYPPDTMAYAWVTLVPSGAQLDHMQNTWDQLNEFRAFRRLVDDFRDEFEDETGLNFDDDIASWIGPDASAGFIDYDSKRDEVVLMVVISVRDADAARGFTRGWLDYMENSQGADFSPGSYKNFDTWIDPDSNQAYGLSGDWFVFSPTEHGLEEIIDGIAGDIDRSLADTERFQETRGAFSDQRFASIYVDYHEATRILEEFEYGEFQTAGPATWAGQDPEWIGATVAWEDRAVSAEIVLPLGIDHPLAIGELEDPARLAPDDSILFAAATFDPNIDNWRAAFQSYKLADLLPADVLTEESFETIQYLAGEDAPELRPGDDLADVVDLGLWVVEDRTSIDLEQDLFDHLAGDTAIAVRDTDFSRLDNDLLLHPIDAAILLSHLDGSERDLADTMADVTDIIDENLGFFIDIDRVNLGNDADATVFNFNRDFADTGYSPGYVLNGGYLTIAATEDMLEVMVDLQDGNVRSLASQPEFQRATGHLPENLQSLLYVDVKRITRQFTADDLGPIADEFAVLESTLGSFALGSHSPHCTAPNPGGAECEIPPGADYSRLTAVLTLFPE